MSASASTRIDSECPARLPAGFPALFVAHGAPTMALQPGAAGAALIQAVAGLPKPRAIIVVSAHWQTTHPTIGCAPAFDTRHDFQGFPPALYDLRYPARSDPAVADRVYQLLRRNGFTARIDRVRGLDHGAWTPLRLLFPAADIPVVALSLQNAGGPDHHFRLGQALAPLLADDILLLASGNVTHNLGDFHRSLVEGATTPAYVRQFADWLWHALDAGDLAALLDYRRQAPHAARAHPSDEHLLPLYVALGAACGQDGDYRAERLYAGVDFAILAMDGFAFRPATAR
ncbi:MAG TPA: class III extradiol ring-cleavage dioxygenase [Accumulibacter sp.]|nr:class III extradiol ring-cleavage dioxygenase [Accumulibacter sp.]